MAFRLFSTSDGAGRAVRFVVSRLPSFAVGIRAIRALDPATPRAAESTRYSTRGSPIFRPKVPALPPPSALPPRNVDALPPVAG